MLKRKTIAHCRSIARLVVASAEMPLMVGVALWQLVKCWLTVGFLGGASIVIDAVRTAGVTLS
jgi:hypothetical protein